MHLGPSLRGLSGRLGVADLVEACGSCAVPRSRSSPYYDAYSFAYLQPARAEALEQWPQLALRRCRKLRRHSREACGARDDVVLKLAGPDGAAVLARAAVRRAGRRGGGEVSQSLAQRRRHAHHLVASCVVRIDRVYEPGLRVADDLLQPEHRPLAAQEDRASNRGDAHNLSSHADKAMMAAAPVSAGAALPQLPVATSFRLVEAVA